MAEYEIGGQVGPQGPPGPAGGNQVNFWFHDDPSDIATYFELLDSPANSAENDDTVSVVLADGEKLIEAYATAPGVPGLTNIPAGNWSFFVYTYASVLGVANVVFRVYKRDLIGTETLLFFVQTPAINFSAPVAQVINYASPAIALAATDRLVVKVFGKTSVAFATTVHFVHDGTLHASWLSIPAAPAVPANIVTYEQSVQGTDTAIGVNTPVQLTPSFSPPTLLPNAIYSAVYSVSLLIWQDGIGGTGNSTIANCDVQINFSTDGAGAALACSVIQPAYFDTSLGSATFVTTKGAVNIIAPGNVIAVTVTRPTGINSHARFKATCLEFERLT
jgi:hypothetical protein